MDQKEKVDRTKGSGLLVDEVIDVNMNLLIGQEIPLDNSQFRQISNYKEHLKELKSKGLSLRSDKDQPSFSDKPVWFNEELFKDAQSVYGRHFMGINFAHLSGLLLLVRVDSIYKTLSLTGESDTVSKLFKRYYNTVKHVKTWYEGDIFDEQDKARRSIMIVRGMHNKVSTKLNDLEQNNQNEKKSKELRKDVISDGVHISEYDLMLTQFAFIGFIVTNAKRMGLIEDFSPKDLDSLLHFWRVIGYYLGISEEYNLCSHKIEDILGLCETITELEYKESIVKNRLIDPPGIMSVNIVRSIKFIPMLTVHGIMRYLYELLGLDHSEVEPRRTWYSNLSYTLIKLVMTSLLAYKPLRSFNNGLTRLSLFCVGKIEDLFSRHLDSKYGQELRI